VGRARVGGGVNLVPSVHRRRVTTGKNVMAVACAITLLLAGMGSVVVAQAALAESPPTDYPPIGLPYAQGTKAVLLAGPHQNNVHGCDSSAPCNALDFGPIAPATNFHVTAAGPGVVQGGLGRCTPGLVFIRMTTGGSFNGWWTGYYHLTNIQVTAGHAVSAGTWIGDLAQTEDAGLPCNGSWDSPHVHFFAKYAPPTCNRSCIGDAFIQTAYDVDLGGVVLGGWQIASTSITACMKYLATSERKCPPSGQVTNYAGTPLPNHGLSVFNGGSTRGLSSCVATGAGFTNCFPTGWAVASGNPAAAVLPSGAALAFFNGGSPRGLSACLGTSGGFSDCFLTGWKVAGSPAAAALPSGEALAFFNGGSTRGLSTCVATSGFSNCFSTGWAVASGSPAAAALPGGYALAFFNGGSTRGLSACGANGGGFFNCYPTGWPVASGNPAAAALPDGHALAFFNGGATRGLSSCVATSAGVSNCFSTGWKVTGTPSASVLPDGNAMAFFNGGSARGLSACLGTSAGFSNCFSTGWKVTGTPSASVLPDGNAMAFFNGGSTRGLSACGANAGGIFNCFDTGWGVASGSPASLVLADASALAFFNGGSTRGLSACGATAGGFFNCSSTGWSVDSGSPVAVGVP
jgi:hypothetical protein